MKSIAKFIIYILFICLNLDLKSQNIGIGNNNPTFKLDVTGRVRSQQEGTSTAGIWFDGTTSPLRTFLGTLDNDRSGIFGGGGAGWNFVINNLNNNIGIGVPIPLYRMDINGRMRIQTDGSNTAGIWMDGVSQPTRSFLGTLNNDYTGFYGGGGTGWNFLMNVNNGNIGLGTTTPTADLDINGNIRIRSNAPVKGSVLTSKDVNGNAEWTNPLCFKVESTVDQVTFVVPENTWTKVLFNQSTVYNYSNAYQPNTSTFIAPYNGIYTFHSSVAYTSYANRHQSIRIQLERNGVVSTINQLFLKGIYRQNNQAYFNDGSTLAVEVNLQTGDKIWVETYAEYFGSDPDGVSPGLAVTFFTGNLITKL